MSRSAAAVNPGSTNRRFVMLAVTLGIIGAVLVYVAFSRDSSTGRGGPADTPVVVAKQEIPARTMITPAMVEVVLVPADVRNALGYAETSAVTGQITRFPVAAREQVLSTKIVQAGPQAEGRSLSYVVPDKMRGFAIQTSEVAGAGGLVLPGDYVDVIVVYDVEFQNAGEREVAEAYLVRTIMQNVEVLAVAQSVADVAPEATPGVGGHRARNSESAPVPSATTVTLALTPDQVQMMYLAEANGRIRLSVRHYGDAEDQPVEFMTEQELWPRNLPNPFVR
jgi:pilus assembly protein CpaB